MPTLVANNLTQSDFETLTTPRSTPANTDDKLPQKFKHSFEVKVQRTFHDLGRRVAARPRRWMAGSAIFALVCFLGLFTPNMKVNWKTPSIFSTFSSLFTFFTFIMFIIFSTLFFMICEILAKSFNI